MEANLVMLETQNANLPGLAEKVLAMLRNIDCQSQVTVVQGTKPRHAWQEVVEVAPCAE